MSSANWRLPTIWGWVLSFVLLASASGCFGRSGAEMIPVAGSVTVDGEPVETGNIIFHSEDPTLGPDASKIHDGKFDFLAKPGMKRVQITATRPVPGKMTIGADDQQVPVREQYIPKPYRTPDSELSVEVTPNDDNQFDFQLKTDGPS